MKLRILMALSVITMFAATTAYAYTEQNVSGGGKISGKITLIGKAPAPRMILMEKNPEVCGTGEREIREVTVDGSGGLQYGVVYIEKIAAGKKWDGKPRQLNQKGCKFVEWLQVMREKTELEIVNRDPVLHNIHTYELIGRVRVTIFNEAQPTQGYTFKKKIKMRRSPVMKIECDAHNFMHAYMLVLKNPYYAITAPDGSYTIDNIPPGKYKVTVWHSMLGKKTQEIEVKSGATTSLNHAYKS
ncbi:MAG: carboxypeptidase-like regulatory domain-containing protein [Nitrospinota bacterium]